MIRWWNFCHRWCCVGLASFTDAPSAVVALWLTGVIFKADSDLSNPISAPEGRGARAGASCRSAELATIKAGRSVKTSPVLPSRAKALLKRFFWGILNVVKWSPPQLGHSKRPSLTTKAKQTPSPLPRPCQFSSNPLGLDPVSRYPTTQGTHIKTLLQPYFPLWLQPFNCALINTVMVFQAAESARRFLSPTFFLYCLFYVAWMRPRLWKQARQSSERDSRAQLASSQFGQQYQQT